MLEPPKTSATEKELRSFGLIMAGMIAFFFGFLIPWIWDLAWPTWPWVFVAFFAILGLAKPSFLAPIYKGWMKFAFALGWFNTRLILSIIFYGIVFPIGLIFKILGKDPMKRKYDKSLESYRKESKQPSKDNLEKPF